MPAGASPHKPEGTEAGSAERIWPLSKIDLLRELQGVVDFDAEVTDGALELAVPKQQLTGSKVACFFRPARPSCA